MMLGKGGSTKRQEEAMVIYAALLPSPRETHTDLFAGDRPLLGILCVLFSFTLYSLILNFPKDANDPY